MYLGTIHTFLYAQFIYSRSQKSSLLFNRAVYPLLECRSTIHPLIVHICAPQLTMGVERPR